MLGADICGKGGLHAGRRRKLQILPAKPGRLTGGSCDKARLALGQNCPP